MTSALTFPAIDPVAIQIGPLAIRWYALAYVAGLLLAWRYCRHLARRSTGGIAPEAFDDFLLWATVGVVLGGRIGYVLFYKPELILADPLEVVAVWHGGMSFHGGLLGVAVAAVIFSRRRRLPMLAMSDIFAAAAPIGLFLGRIANFVNGELVGRPSDVPWAIVFPHAGQAQVLDGADDDLVDDLDDQLDAALDLLLLDVEDRRVGLPDEMAHDRRADEARPARHDDPQVRILLQARPPGVGRPHQDCAAAIGDQPAVELVEHAFDRDLGLQFVDRRYFDDTRFQKFVYRFQHG